MGIITRLGAAVLALTALSSVAPVLHAQATKKTVAGISNFTQVDATVACGGATTPDAIAALKEQGFASVINLRLASEPGANVENEKAVAEQAGLRYVHIPFDGTTPDPSVVDEFLKAIADKANQPAYVHCGSGNRVGAVWLVKRVMVDGWTRERATEEATVIGLTSPVLKQFALDYLTRQGK